METFSDKVVGYKTLMNFTTEVFLEHVQDFLNTFLYTHVKKHTEFKKYKKCVTNIVFENFIP